MGFLLQASLEASAGQEQTGYIILKDLTITLQGEEGGNKRSWFTKKTLKSCSIS